MKTTHVLFVFAALAETLAIGQTFDVASVRPSELTIAAIPSMSPDTLSKLGLHVDGRRVEIRMWTLRELLLNAYGLKSAQFETTPWIANHFYDIRAILPEGATDQQVPAMLRTLLAERFHLKFHREIQEQDVYALVQEKGGALLTKVIPPDPASPDPAGCGAVRIAFGSKTCDLPSEKGQGAVRVTRHARGYTMKVYFNTPANPRIRTEYEGVTMDDLVDQLNGGSWAERPVVDKTGLVGTYRVVVNLSLEDYFSDSDRPDEPEGIPPPTLRESLKSQGLKLERQKVGIEQFVIDSVDQMPAEN